MTPYRNPDHELWPGLLDGIPAVFGSQIEEPAFGDEEGSSALPVVAWAVPPRAHTGRPRPAGPGRYCYAF